MVRWETVNTGVRLQVKSHLALETLNLHVHAFIVFNNGPLEHGLTGVGRGRGLSLSL